MSEKASGTMTPVESISRVLDSNGVYQSVHFGIEEVPTLEDTERQFRHRLPTVEGDEGSRPVHTSAVGADLKGLVELLKRKGYDPVVRQVDLVECGVRADALKEVRKWVEEERQRRKRS